MAASDQVASSSLPNEADEVFDTFYTEVKEIEKRDSVLTPKQQIDRLLRPGSTYFNLNPFEVLQIEPDASADVIKKQYRRLSFLIHPDKNQNDSERAQNAFDIVNRSYKILDNPDTKQKCLDVIEEANARTEMMVQEKKKKLKKEGKDPRVDEDDPEKLKHAVYVMSMKLFADMERKKRELEQRDMEERKRKREEEIAVEEQAKMDKEWQKNFEASREGRVNSWKHFQQGSKNKKAKSGKSGKSEFRPPKHKAETSSSLK